jgi:signal transduction histidine kinase
MAHIRLFNDSVGNEYMIFLNASLEPMAPLVHTLQQQFIWIFVILVLFSIAYVIPMSKKIARPLVHMNEAAKQLAIGNYDADFGVDHGYKETRELAETLTLASRELSKTDRMQKELTANISHDLRTPLTMIRGYAEVMRDIPEENTPENLQILIDETDRLTDLVNDLMDLSKIQSGVHAPVMEFFDLTSAIREVLCRYEAFTKSQGYCITFDAEQNVPVFADRGMILQVIYNLINNAIHYTGEDLRVYVKQTVRDGKVRFSVKDTGEGIPEDQLNLIWDRYYKVDKTHRSARVGTGLGLSIVKGILGVHSADYGVESKLGEGSEFWFELPISAPPQHFDDE